MERFLFFLGRLARVRNLNSGLGVFKGLLVFPGKGEEREGAVGGLKRSWVRISGAKRGLLWGGGGYLGKLSTVPFF